jgi:glycosyltransferase involved in cell wall biosynthesis
MSDPLVSIIIDNYNYAQYVGAAIQSALDQTYPHVEVIVVDDGSADESRAEIARFGNRVTALFQENTGQSTAFFAGFRASRGEIVLFLDADDAMRPEAVATIVEAWRPDVAKLQWCLASVDGAGRFLGNVFPNFPPGLTSAAIRDEVLRTALYPCPPTSGNAYARWFLDKVMPFYLINCGADGPLNTVAPLYGETVTISRPLGYYRVHGRNDGAQGALDPGKFARFIRMDQMRSAYLRLHAARLDLEIAGEPLDRAIIHLQYRLASLKLRPDQHPIPGERLAGLTAIAVTAAMRTSDRIAARLCLAAWYLAVALAPRPWAERLVTWRFVPSSRSKGLRNILRRLGIVRGGSPDEPGETLDLPPRLAASGRAQAA